MTVSMKVIVKLHNGERLTLDNVDARHINVIEETVNDGEYTELQIRNMDNPRKSIQFFLSDLEEISFENGA